jgi:hypothetical protein
MNPTDDPAGGQSEQSDREDAIRSGFTEMLGTADFDIVADCSGGDALRGGGSPPSRCRKRRT